MIDPLAKEPPGAYHIPTESELAGIFSEQVNHNFATAYHVATVAIVTTELATMFGIPEQEISLMRSGAIFHDTGKLEVPAAYLITKKRDTPDPVLKILADHEHIGYERYKARFGEPHPIIADMFHHHGHSGDVNTLTNKAAESDSVHARLIGIADGFCGTIDRYLGIVNDKPEQFRPFAKKIKTPQQAYTEMCELFGGDFANDQVGQAILTVFKDWFEINFNGEGTSEVPYFIRNGEMARFFATYAPEHLGRVAINIEAAEHRVRAFVTNRDEP